MFYWQKKFTGGSLTGKGNGRISIANYFILYFIYLVEYKWQFLVWVEQGNF